MGTGIAPKGFLYYGYPGRTRDRNSAVRVDAASYSVYIEAPLTFLSIPAAEKHDIPFAMFVAECSCLRVCSTKPGLLSRVDGSLASNDGSSRERVTAPHQ
jgi:hypothetical protein